MSGKLPSRKIAPRLGSGFGLGLALELGLGAILLGGNFPRTVMYKYASYKYYKYEKKALSKTLYIY